MKNITKRVISLLLAAIMLVGILPIAAFASGKSTNYDDFMEDLKQLELYAETYGQENYRDPGELVLNFIRTGVERYQDDNWNTLAHGEVKGFTSYVQMQDAETGSTVMDLRDIVPDEFILPNGDQVDFGHMFGCMNISYVSTGSADLSGWAGDLCDLFYYSSGQIDEIIANTDGSVEKMANYVLANYFGIPASNGFGMDDFYGDMDAYYLISEFVKYNGRYDNSKPKVINKKLSQIMEEYFTTTLDSVSRAVFFVNDRFGVEDLQIAVRKAIYESYSSDLGVKFLEANRDISELNDLRQACCYAFADYVYGLAKGQLVADNEDENVMDNDYYSVFSTTESTLAPGITQEINYAQTVDGKQIVYYIATVDVTRDDVTIMANYKDNDPSNGWGYQRVADQAQALVSNYKGKYENFSAIVAINADGYTMATGEPGGLLVMDGIEWHAVDSDGYFAILSDGSAMIGTKADYETYKSQIKEAVGGFGAVLVKNGRINVTKNANYVGTRASRTAIGIKEDGTVVMMVLDGRQLPFSAGGALEEIAQIMLDAGCVNAINLDGGGSTTYLSKPAGSDDLQLINRPSDGYARSVATSLVAVSTAKSSREFDHAIISSDYEYITPGTSMQITVTGVSNTGNNAPIPKDAYWKVSNEAVGTITDEGVFMALSTGEVRVDFMIDDVSVGGVTINVVIPDALSMESAAMTAIYGVESKLPIIATYNGNKVATKETDFFVKLQYDDAATVNGLSFTPIESSKYRTFVAGAALLANTNLIAYLQVNVYRADEATFDFDNCTMGNRTFAWIREVENTKTLDDQLYRITDPNDPVVIDYTFALDMTSIDIPAQLEPLKAELPGGDNPDSTAWSFLLNLAERVCELTTVTITAKFDSDLNVDISNLKIINDYFVLKEATLGEDNTVTVVCSWKNQTKPIDAATANPLCILSGVKLTVKKGVEYKNNELIISNSGYVSYDIYLAATTLYKVSQDKEYQQTFGLFPYLHEEDCRGEFNSSTDEESTATNNDKGAHFTSRYAEFMDIYAINNEIRNAWQGNSYYVENEAVTGVQFIPCKEDTSKKYFYEFDENGILIGALSGLIEYNNGLYYAMNGEPQKRWASLTGENGEQQNYYFDPTTYKAVNGEQKIGEDTYVFEDYVLVKGCFRAVKCSSLNDGCKIHSGTGIGYRWAGNWVQGQWLEVDGKSYYFQKYHYVADTGLLYKDHNSQDVDRDGYYLFDENGVFMKEFTGIYKDYYIENGTACSYTWRLVELDGAYYFIDGSTLKICKNGSYRVNNVTSQGLVPAAVYEFGADGKMINPPVGVVTKGTIEYTVSGREVTVTNEIACKVGYLVDGKYVALKATAVTEQKHTFTVPEGVLRVVVVVAGDTNGDGALSNSDKTKLNAALLEKTTLTPEAVLAADTNGDGALSNSDKTKLNAVLLGKTKMAW